MMTRTSTSTTLRPRPAPVVTDRGDLVGRFADFTIGTAVVLWHLALAERDRRRHAPPARRWSSTR